MRFISIYKPRKNTPPSPQMMEAMGKFINEALSAGVLLATEGFGESTKADARILLENGKLQVVDGPFTEAKEVIGGFAIYELASKADAMAWAMRFMKLHVEHWPAWEGECEVRAMYSEGDGPKTK